MPSRGTSSMVRSKARSSVAPPASNSKPHRKLLPEPPSYYLGFESNKRNTRRPTQRVLNKTRRTRRIHPYILRTPCPLASPTGTWSSWTRVKHQILKLSLRHFRLQRASGLGPPLLWSEAPPAHRLPWAPRRLHPPLPGMQGRCDNFGCNPSGLLGVETLLE